MIAELLQEFEAEVATTRAVLNAIPGDKLAYKPHEKSMTLGALAGHIAEIPGWYAGTLMMDVLSMDDYKPSAPTSKDEILAAFEEGVKHGREALKASSEATLRTGWQMTMGGKALIDGKKGEVLRTWCCNHLVHHRAQLGVYLRLLDVPVPSVYGPTADFPNCG
jgi:uncharacterized damage-inducible protein DinB